ncbi:type II toxin-antitoxin system HicA family toxin [Porphyromonas sp.]|uniref:type II toxin-antitoxin system HicA family toxin n=1 Tax=Porphyromonas sp. TaxID=1924944 RepID=UPI003AAB62A8
MVQAQERWVTRCVCPPDYNIRGRIIMPRHGAKEVPVGTEKAILKQARGGK